MIEITTFRLRPGVTDETFEAADTRQQTEVAYQRPGLVRRTTARGDDGRWLVLTLWASAADAERAASVGTAAAEAFDGCIDTATVRTDRYTPLD